jgi:ubiquinone/menaquinone biosynthesis C-methylase UbiE
MLDLPYFDLLIDERQDGGETGQLWENQVHWGYWDDPKAADGTRADYVGAMEQMNDVLLEAGRVADGQKLLDVGCGFGGTIQQINAAHSDMDLTGLNIDPRQLAAADAQTNPTHGNKIGWIEADACQLPFEDNSFDRVLAVECIFHFPSREKFIAEAARVLKPGGYLAVDGDSLPDREVIRNARRRTPSVLQGDGQTCGSRTRREPQHPEEHVADVPVPDQVLPRTRVGRCAADNDRRNPMDQMADQDRAPSVPGLHVPQTCLTRGHPANPRAPSALLATPASIPTG